MMKFKILSLTILLVISNITLAGQVGTASWYGKKFHGRKTASGAIFDTNKMTAAHKTLKFGTKVKVTNLKNKKTAIVTINDRGPYVRKRIIDLSRAAKKKLGMDGLTKVKLEILK